MTSNASGMPYRPDIDGLRAVAVLSVVFCHAGLSFPGGYVGVDVFFVISGYLITGLILKDLDRGTFSLADFWVRRIRRILPALLAVTVAAALAGWFLLIPSAYASLGKSIVGLALLVSNVQFWRETGYFTATAEEKPLLHTWSLAVEEQFYLFVPVLLLILARVLRLPARVLARRPGRDREPGPEHLRDPEVCLRDVLPAPHQGLGTLRRRMAGHPPAGLARRLAAREGMSRRRWDSS